MSTENQNKSLPQSMRHRRILDVAAENPSASIDEVASQVPSATPELVEQVFEEHGDPATADESSPGENENMSASTSPNEGEDAEKEDSNAESESTADAQDEPAVSEEQAATDKQSATAEQDAPDEDGEETAAEIDRYPPIEELSEKHQALIETVAAQPAATQGEIAAEFDVTRATISRWAGEIPGFEWRERESFVNAVVNDDHTTDMNDHATADTDTAESNQSTTTADDDDPAATVDEIETDLEALSERVAKIEASDTESERGSDPVFNDPELVHKIVHACLESDTISEEEELRILKRLLE